MFMALPWKTFSRMLRVSSSGASAISLSSGRGSVKRSLSTTSWEQDGAMIELN